MRVAIHQPNFIPWFPYFYKMAKVDVFILMKYVQFEKNGYQNRFNHKGKWITKPVRGGRNKIAYKDYVGLEDKRYLNQELSLANLNEDWIRVLADTLNIKTKITDDQIMHQTRPVDKTLKLIDIIKTNPQVRNYDGQVVYVTNETAKDKYLDEDKMRDHGIEIEYVKCPKNLQKSTFEILEIYGIEGAIRQLKK